jgi:hypothetical protein
MSCFIKQLRESIKRQTGVDPADCDLLTGIPRSGAKKRGVPLSQILKECPRMVLDLEFGDDPSRWLPPDSKDTH